MPTGVAGIFEFGFSVSRFYNRLSLVHLVEECSLREEDAFRTVVCVIYRRLTFKVHVNPLHTLVDCVCWEYCYWFVHSIVEICNILFHKSDLTVLSRAEWLLLLIVLISDAKIVIFLEIGKKKSNYFLYKIKFFTTFLILGIPNQDLRKNGVNQRWKRWPYKQ